MVSTSLYILESNQQAFVGVTGVKKAGYRRIENVCMVVRPHNRLVMFSIILMLS